MKKNIYLLISLFILSFAVCLPKKEGKAIPAFGRKYRISCQTCHSPAMPKLKEFGDEFAGNGFRLSEYESPRYFLETGDSKLNLIREFPIAVRLDGHITCNNADNNTLDFGTPFGLKILSGGELSDKLSYYFYFYMNERGEVAGVEDAFLMYHDLFGTGLNISLGQFQVCDPLFKRELRLTLEDYGIYTVKPGNSTISLKYDRGVIVEYGLPTGTDMVAMIVNGNGIGEAGNEILFDKDKYKNYFFKLSQSLGSHLNVGFFGYSGKEELGGIPGTVINQATFYGPDLTFTAGDKFECNLQYLRRLDSKVRASNFLILDDVLTHGGLAEIIYSPKGDMSNWYLTGLLNWIESDINDLNYKTTTLHAGYLLQRNVRLVGEYTRYFGDDDFGRASVGFVSAF